MKVTLNFERVWQHPWAAYGLRCLRSCCMLRSLHRASSVGTGMNERWNERDRKEIEGRTEREDSVRGEVGESSRMSRTHRNS